jgi:hypothetical protein
MAQQRSVSTSIIGLISPFAVATDKIVALKDIVDAWEEKIDLLFQSAQEHAIILYQLDKYSAGTPEKSFLDLLKRIQNNHSKFQNHGEVLKELKSKVMHIWGIVSIPIIPETFSMIIIIIRTFRSHFVGSSFWYFR